MMNTRVRTVAALVVGCLVSACRTADVTLPPDVSFTADVGEVGQLQTTAWRVELVEGQVARSTLTVRNRCAAPHLFAIASSAAHLRFERRTNSVLIEARAQRRFGMRIDASGLAAGVYPSTIRVTCRDCVTEAGCRLDREVFPVELIVTNRAQRAIRGRVVDPSNTPVAGVRAQVPGRAATFTDATGEFTIADPPRSNRLAVSFSAPRFIDTTRIYDSRQQAGITDVLVIWPRSAPLRLDAERGGRLTFPAGHVTFPPRALIDEQGRPIRGDVDVSFSTFDVTDPRQYQSAPGDFTARLRDNSIRRLDTFGVFEIYVADNNGRRARLANGQTVAVALTVPEPLQTIVPDIVDSYRFEETTGLWIEEGTLTLAGNELQTDLTTIENPWNADLVMETTCINVTLDCKCGTAPADFSVAGEALNYSFEATKADPCENVKRNDTVDLTPSHDPKAVTITTPDLTTNCFDKGSCRDVIFHCAKKDAVNEDLDAYDNVSWEKSFYANDTNPAFADMVWQQGQVTHGGGQMTLELAECTAGDCKARKYTSGEYQSACFYRYGEYESSFTVVKEPGVVTTFFVYTGQPRHDEIDVEVLGRDPNSIDKCPAGQTVLQTNYFTNGKMITNGKTHERYTCLDYDATELAKPHPVKFVWSAGGIQWFADQDGDGALDPDPIRTVPSAGDDAPWPTQPGKIIVNMWAGSAAAKDWLGTFQYDKDKTYKATYDYIRHKPE